MAKDSEDAVDYLLTVLRNPKRKYSYAGHVEELMTEWSGWPAEADCWTRELHSLAEDADGEVSRLRTALFHLANEVRGLRVREPQLRSAIGNTNWSVLQLREREARDELGLRGNPADICATCGKTRAQHPVSPELQCAEFTDE